MAVNEGRYIVVQFDQDLQGILEDHFSRFQVLVPILYSNPSVLEPVLTPMSITSISWYNGRRDAILIELGNNNRETLQSAAGTTYVRYLGGSLRNAVGPLLSFMEGFTPEGVDYKGDQNDVEHLELKNITPEISLTRIYYLSGYLPAEHIQFEDVSWEYTLTHIDDL